MARFAGAREAGDGRHGVTGVRLATIKSGGAEQAALIRRDGAVPLARVDAALGTDFGTDLFALLGAGRIGELARLTEGSSVPAIPFEEVEYGPPFRRPRKLWGIGLNYAEHATDLDEGSPSEEPASFMRPDTAIVGPGDEIRLPKQSDRVTGEAELAVVIGREAKDVPPEEALSVVAGFTTVLDMTAEDILRRNPRFLTRAKSFDTFFSFGPHLVTPDEIDDPGSLEVSTVSNGEVVRSNVVSNMTFSPMDLVSFHSEVMTLLPGDVISTGTPGAVEIKDGDILECRISGFEPLSNPVGRGFPLP